MMRLAIWRRGRWPVVDFLHPQGRIPALAWAWLACAGLVVLLVALELWQARSGVEAARAEVAMLEQRQRSGAAGESNAPGSRNPPAFTGPRTGPDQPALQASQPTTQQASALAVAQALAHPWPTVFQALEGEVVSGVRWTGFQHQAGQGIVLTGLAESADQATRVWRRLRDARLTGEWTDWQMVQWSQAGGGVRFTLSVLQDGQAQAEVFATAERAR